MRLARLVCLVPVVFLIGCPEQPLCVEREFAGMPRVEIDCSAGKIPVCGDDSDALYDPMTGALRPVSTNEDGSCNGLAEGTSCRVQPVCGAAGDAPTCADGTTPLCRLGSVTIVRPMTPIPDSGPPPGDDAGTPDAGPQDAGGADAGGTDAGGTDAGATDAGPDSGPVDGG